MLRTDFSTPNKLKEYKSAIEFAIGNTPLIQISNVAKQIKPHVKIFAKAEWLNSGGSIKDRPALKIIQNAISQELLSEDIRLLDSTSGNMGIAYASICASMGIGVTLTLPENASPERLTILSALGAELILTDPLEGSDGAMIVARKIAKDFPKKYYFADQYNNPNNWMAHFETTGPEIWNQTKGGVTHFVAGLGTSGTVTGVTKYLKEQNEEIQSVAFQPESPFHGIEGLKHMPSSHLPGIYEQGLPDINLQISTEKSYEMVRRLAKEEGLFVGLSSGASIQAAIELAKDLEEGVIVTTLPDGGYKYISNQIWES
ncbi:MAG: cysteine synthase family protein [Chloroflexi bacterium]|jgi:S-sulfo-L-cysteine synthase (O-acetyl-L-serine-dependent)|nr:cysteine synthase family protein [Chloroflexota bacterium]MBT4003658.1 cysteine synthase family protein [Chloroflexota bacterium]MBT4305836.1 cysteine synthase family protein [Chloroflexota bacterium]MBT4533660.1 cysteine synthase family protein [Chloroflexota bacterium]MBT4681697.1 cysteine synthase family protein [Chloroflexota bacterium]